VYIIPTDYYTLKRKLNKLKKQVYAENASELEISLAHKYLSKAIVYVDELQLY
jgi:hypothetical protein